MKKLLWVAALTASAVARAAQPVTYEAYTITEFLMQKTWAQVGPMMDDALVRLDKNLRESGASDRAAKAMVASMRQGFSREAFSKLSAENISAQMSLDEQRSALAFINSPAGQKFFSISSPDNAEVTKMTYEVLTKACEFSQSALDPKDSATLQKFCKH